MATLINTFETDAIMNLLNIVILKESFMPLIL